MNWMQRARHELRGDDGRGTADTAEGSPTAATAVPCSPTCEICRAEFEERAAIMEYDGGLPRHEAERLAAVDVCRTSTDGHGSSGTPMEEQPCRRTVRFAK